MEHKKWVILCIMGGILMVLSSLVGRVGVIGTIISLLSGVVTPEIQQVLVTILSVFSYIAAAGGLAVIIGALIAGFSSVRLGRFIVGLGIGTSLVSIIILVITSIIGGSTIIDIPIILFTAFNNAYGLAGVVFSIIGGRKLKD